MGGRDSMRATTGGHGRALALLAVLGLLPVAGLAAPTRKPPRPAPAKVDPTAALLQKGVAARQSGELATARQALTAAYRLRPSPELLRELGLLARAEQRPVEAQDLFRRYLAEVEASPATATSRAEIESLLETTLPATGRLRVLGEPGALVSLDGHLLGALPLSAPLLVSTDEHKLFVEQRAVAAEAQIQVSANRMAEVRAGQSGSRVLLVELLPAALLITERVDAAPAQPQATAASDSQSAKAVDGESAPATAAAARLRAVEAGLGAALEQVHMTGLSARAALEFTGAKRLAACLDQTVCQTELARLCALDHVLRLRVPRSAAAASFELELIDLSVGDVAAKSGLSCVDCEPPRLISQLAETTAALVSQAQARPRGQLEIQSEPSGAEVALNGHVIGHTPYRSAYFVGAHTLRVRRPNSEPDERRLVISEGQTTSVRVVLTLLPEKKPPPPPPLRRVVRTEVGKRPRWRLVTGGLALAAGGLMLGFGGRGLAIADTCSTPPLVPDGECEYRYETTSLGAGLVGAGGALAITGAVLIALPGEKRRIEELVP